jgi:hypothetical protein
MFESCRTPVRATVLTLGTVLLLAGGPGCGSGIPKTYPVKGKVVWKGGKPVDDGRIEFQSLSEPDLKAVGEIESDGTFSLTTFKEGKTREGAVAGQHKVVVEPDMGDGKPALVVTLPNPYTVEPKRNDFTIEIAPSRR